MILWSAVVAVLVLIWVLGMLWAAASEYREMKEQDRTWFDRQRESTKDDDQSPDGGAL